MQLLYVTFIVVIKLNCRICNIMRNLETKALRVESVHLFVCLFVSLSLKCVKTRFSQKLSNLELWSLLTTNRKSCMGLSKNPLLDP